MNFNQKRVAASIMATAIIMPTMGNLAYANESEIESSTVESRTITGNAVNFRKGPGTNNASIGKFYKGDKVEYIGKDGSWVKVKYNGNTGYVHEKYLSINSLGNSNESNDASVKSTKVVTAKGLNFRTGPSTGSSKISTLGYGTEVGYISESNGWSKISSNGRVGYVSSKYLGTNLSDSANGNDGSSSSDIVKDTKVVTAKSLNLRTGPGTGHSKVATLSYGTEVGSISEDGGWTKVNHDDQTGYVSSQYLAEKGSVDTSTPSDSTNSPSQGADSVIGFAKTLLGKPYVWGAEGPNSFDCSGFTQYVMKKSAGVSIPRVSRDQSKYGAYVNRGDLRSGDLIFFDTQGSNNGSVSHVGIYMGNGEMIHASSGSSKKVTISNINSSYYSSRYVNARRVL
ncbi:MULTISPECIES: C40 family peptidase [unclassified Clostridioides]|uniref:C40 family peptidase n=1 Tax=unclassified Clostridioides TaxID=2635829 RepID=UPI001D0C33E0|nr:SH3 domain-containing protein [Clostridioides sp. ES-S-0001-02]MCC0652860.1 SH3 domain-containing protein [Clostridioides sp. ES-S-0001-03]MCC0657153.1 SH3 domain-containing protein [Clostridioides sp. ES-S-0123-01]MCC0672567.1 SH3 domain-containing protein [Clostridioides sp. ES-S-0145-01]MCC0701825.1 SH3 domain-containing protein [Clostridioides sp. ES-S-0049-02]MCC0707688.1 SH3 domain-containing protein [Clostridioides sp. ES-S-0190-01]